MISKEVVVAGLISSSLCAFACSSAEAHALDIEVEKTNSELQYLINKGVLVIDESTGEYKVDKDVMNFLSTEGRVIKANVKEGLHCGGM